MAQKCSKECPCKRVVPLPLLIRADIFSEVGKKTPCMVRFSTVGGESGSADTAR